jgi:hypothetical protein
MEKKKKNFINPIDKEKISETPHSLPYAHHVGSAIVKPEDKGKIRGKAMAAMREQANLQLRQIQEQIELLKKQAESIANRIKISEKIYLSDLKFEPVIGNTYYLYQNQKKQWQVSMLSPDDWGQNPPYQYIATIKLLGDYTWEIIDLHPESEKYLNHIS